MYQKFSKTESQDQVKEMQNIDIEKLRKMTLEEVKENVKTEAGMKLWEFIKREEKRKTTHHRDIRNDALSS